MLSKMPSLPFRVSLLLPPPTLLNRKTTLTRSISQHGNSTIRSTQTPSARHQSRTQLSTCAVLRSTGIPILFWLSSIAWFPIAIRRTGQPASPLTRYQVLLQFFRTLSFMMMLGGGVTALVVSAYRAYVLPKVTAMFDARSIILKHHIVLFV